MNETIYKSKYHGSKNKTKLYDTASIPLMTTEEQSEFEKVLLKNKAVQLQVVNKNDVYKNFQPPELPVAFFLFQKRKNLTFVALNFLLLFLQP